MDVEQVVDKATTFLVKSGYPTYKLLTVKLDKTRNEWDLKFDVGAIMIQYVNIVVDDISGRIVSYGRGQA